MEPKFKVRDRVKILDNPLHQKYVGEVGRISKVYNTFSPARMNYEYLYRVNVKGRLLPGVACEDDLELVEHNSKNNGKESNEERATEIQV